MIHPRSPNRKGKCEVCGRESFTISRFLKVCVYCIRDNPDRANPYIKAAHHHVRNTYCLPKQPPNAPYGVSCNICANDCRMNHNSKGYCGLKWGDQGRLKSFISSNKAYVHTYYDKLPTNCCSAWFCPGCTGRGYNNGWALKPNAEHGSVNLAVFFYGCNFNCLFCQNESHRNVQNAPSMSLNQVLTKAMDPLVTCICYFGGDPGPHLPFAINTSQHVLERSDSKNPMRICWETNGISSPNLMRKAAKLSLISGGIMKIDLKAYDPNIAHALSGVSNQRAYENFSMIADDFFELRPEVPVLTGVTLLTPGYTDEIEIEKIAQFIAKLNPNIPYSLLVFHPANYMNDLPITPPQQVERCYHKARKYLKHVHIGNEYLLPNHLKSLAIDDM